MTEVLPRASLVDSVRQIANGREIDALAVADSRANATTREITGQDLDFAAADRIGRDEVIRAIGGLRLHKGEEEIAEMRRTAEVTRQAHLAAITHTRPGIYEQELAGLVDGCFSRHGCVPAYNTILSVRGEVLHNHSHDNVLRETDIVLLDGGAENAFGYCSDVTRSWPVSGKFNAEGREVYDIVLRSELAAIEAVKPGARYRDLHLIASRVIAEGLADMKLLKGNPDSLVESGAHALFFPHGVGHLIGLDVHDMEAFGDAIAYADDRSRSEQFGLSYLRLDLDLEPGMTFTIEPGIYFVPAILQNDDFRAKFKDQVDFERAEHFLTMHGLRGFGGIRNRGRRAVHQGGRGRADGRDPEGAFGRRSAGRLQPLAAESPRRAARQYGVRHESSRRRPAAVPGVRLASAESAHGHGRDEAAHRDRCVSTPEPRA